MIIGKPHLYIVYRNDKDEEVKLGPYYTARTAGFDCISYQWTCYVVQDEQLQFNRICVPWSHSFQAITF